MDLTLFKLEAELHDLVNLREQMEEQGEDTGPIDNAIADYIRREVRKVDGIRDYIKHAEMIADAADAEAKAQKRRRDIARAAIDRLKEFVKAVMIETETTRLDGAKGKITLQKNGGSTPVVINNDLLIPEYFYDYTGMISGAELDFVKTSIGDMWFKRIFGEFLKTPNKDRIRKELETICETCGGDGLMQGNKYNTVGCLECNGTGKRLVPGAHLGDRGQHVRIY